MRKLKDKHVFISFEQGASGHKLARVLATICTGIAVKKMELIRGT